MGMNSRIRAPGNTGKHETAWELGIKWELMIEERQVLVAYWIYSPGVFHNAVSLNKSLLEDKENVLIFDTNIGTDFPRNIPVCVCLLISPAKAYSWLLSQWDELYVAVYPRKGKLWMVLESWIVLSYDKVLSLDGTFRWEVNITNNKSKILSSSPIMTQLIPSTLQILILLNPS